ncbi:hypothetical protein OXX80_011029 [Metschnikowia pulcherrima]
MMYTIAILATVVVSMSIEHPLVSETVLAKEFRPVSSGPFVQDTQVPNTEWFNRIPLIGKGPNGCDFSDMEIASLYHLRLVETHPKYLDCQRRSVKAGTEPQLSRNMKRGVEFAHSEEVASPSFEDFLDAEDSETEDSETEDSESVDPDNMTWQQYSKKHPDHFEKEKANKEATMTKVAELTKEFEALKASLPAASDGKIEDLESYEPIRRQFKQLLSKSRLLDIRYDQVTDLKKGIEEFSQTISNYNAMASNMCSSGRATSCVHFNQRKFHYELLNVQKKFIVLENDVISNEDKTDDLLQSYRSRLDALRSRLRVIFDVEISQWDSFRDYYSRVLGEVSHTDYEIDQMLLFW